MLDAIKENEYIDVVHIRMAIPLAKKLKQHDLVKDLEGKLTVAISEERRQRDEENKEIYDRRLVHDCCFLTFVMFEDYSHVLIF